ncbi:Hypothetical predicted protein [Marmota monax]|uniref:EGF-like domain-containing protein n=1 Tax=Marmota monax TaxID=9995 RepID=A0A5E4APV5_MARMO|nr:hypothetical protein GHT09_016075 [Marmota monax]VTJ59195.1 Hypothetical predicted protein [Marmota monax]
MRTCLQPVCCLVSTECYCNPLGSIHDRCNGSGFCECKTGTTGPKCDECLPGNSWHYGCQPNVCDNELLHCQNGGTCHNNVRCLCPAAYTGILCEKLRCEEAGSCGSDSSQGAPPQGSLALLLLLLLTTLLGTASPLLF